MTDEFGNLVILNIDNFVSKIELKNYYSMKYKANAVLFKCPNSHTDRQTDGQTRSRHEIVLLQAT